MDETRRDAYAVPRCCLAKGSQKGQRSSQTTRSGQRDAFSKKRPSMGELSREKKKRNRAGYGWGESGLGSAEAERGKTSGEWVLPISKKGQTGTRSGGGTFTKPGGGGVFDRWRNRRKGGFKPRHTNQRGREQLPKT